MTQFTRINIAIVPAEKIAQSVVDMARVCTAGVESYFGVDGINFHPHLTIYPPEIPSEKLDVVIEALEKLLKPWEPFELEFGGIATNWGYIDVEIKPNEKLQKLHEQIVQTINPLREDRVREKYQDPNSIAHFSIQQKKLLFDYGYADALELYRPHLTFCRLENETEAADKASSLNWPHRSMTLDTIGIFKSGEHGTCVELIRQFGL